MAPRFPWLRWTLGTAMLLYAIMLVLVMLERPRTHMWVAEPFDRIEHWRRSQAATPQNTGAGAGAGIGAAPQTIAGLPINSRELWNHFVFHMPDGSIEVVRSHTRRARELYDATRIRIRESDEDQREPYEALMVVPPFEQGLVAPMYRVPASFRIPLDNDPQLHLRLLEAHAHERALPLYLTREPTPAELAAVERFLGRYGDPALNFGDRTDELLAGPTRHPLLLGFLLNSLWIGSVLLAPWLLISAANRTVRWMRWSRGEHCPTCGYAMRGLPDGPCPECGEAQPKLPPDSSEPRQR